MRKLAILIPAFNEEENISGVISGVLSRDYGFDKVECVVIDDGSFDNTYSIAIKSGAIVIQHSNNRGVGAAFASGIGYALKSGADMAVSIDADGQFNPDEISAIIKPITSQKADFATGNRFTKGKPANMSAIKYWGNLCMSKLISSLAGEKFQDVSCGFRAYNKKAMLNLNLFGKFTYTQETFLDLKFKNMDIKEVPVSVKYFKNRKSRLANNLFKYAWKTFSIIVRSFIYYKPLRFFGYPGFLSLFIGLFFVGFLIVYRLAAGSYSPYKAFGFIGGGLMLFGLLLIMTGLLADIIDKIRQNQEKLLYFEKKKRFK